MILTDLAKKAERLIINNSPAILTAIGVTGTISVAVLTGRATFKAAALIQEHNENLDVHDSFMPVKEKVQLVWKEYIPPAIIGALTIGAIIGANRIGARRAAAIAALYSLSEKAMEEYKSKVIEKLGEKKEEAIRDEVAQDRVNRMPPVDREVIVMGNGSVLCMDGPSGRYFLSDMETIRTAENDINHQIIHDSYASQSDFYDMIGLPHNEMSDDVGWNLDKMLEVKFTGTITPEGKKPCMVVSYKVDPVRGYHRLQ